MKSSASVSHRQIFAFVWTYLRKHLRVLTLMVLMLLISTGLTLLQPFFYKHVVDIIAGSVPGDSIALRNALHQVFLGVGCGVISLTLHEVSSFLLGRIQTRVLAEAHADVFARVQRLSTRFHVNAFAGGLSRKIGRGVDGIEGMLDRLWFNFLPLIVFTVGLAAVLTFVAPLVGAVMLGGMMIYLVISVSLNLMMARYHAWTDRQDTRLSASLVDALTGNALVKAFGAEDRENLRHGYVLFEWQRRLQRTWRIGNFSVWVQFMVLMLIEAAVFSLAAVLWYKGKFSPGSFIVVLFYIGQLWGRMFDIGQQIRQYLQSKAHCEEMVALAMEPLEVDDVPGATELTVQRGAVEFDRVAFRYENQHNAVFRNFSLSIIAGEKVALVGHSGGGKSSFVKLLLRLYDLDSGAIRIDGQDIRTVTQQSLRCNVALVPQDPILFHRSIAENISYAKPDASRAEVERAAKLAHAHEFISKLPKGYDTLVGERGVKLSGGERQRVAIARAILADAPILILDEATSSLDSESESYIQDALSHLMEGRTTIVIAHRLSTVKSVDRIIVLDDGAITEEGSHSALIKKADGLYRQFFELQAGGFLGE